MTDAPRTTEYPVDPLFIQRWSPRAFDGAAMPHADLATILEAAGWAPSAFNLQPWRFLYADRDGPDWQRFLGLLLPYNAAWAAHASVLVFILSDRLVDQAEGEPTPSLSDAFDAGAAWALLALQATRLGYYTHGMTGIDFERARTELRVPDRFRINAAAAIGRLGDKTRLSEKLQAREMPSRRKPLAEFASAGGFMA